MKTQYMVRTINLATLATDYQYCDDLCTALNAATRFHRDQKKVVSVRESTHPDNDFCDDTSKEIVTCGYYQLKFFESEFLKIPAGDGVTFNDLFGLLSELSHQLERIRVHYNLHDVKLLGEEGESND